MRDPDTCVTRDRSAQSFFSISATWSSGSKPNFGGSPSVRTTMLALSSGPDRRALVGNARQPQHQPLELGLLAGELAFQRRRLRARFLRLAAELGFLFGRSRP